MRWAAEEEGSWCKTMLRNPFSGGVNVCKMEAKTAVQLVLDVLRVLVSPNRIALS